MGRGFAWSRPWPHQQLSLAFRSQGEALDLAIISPDPRWTAGERLHCCSGPRADALNSPTQEEDEFTLPQGEDQGLDRVGVWGPEEVRAGARGLSVGLSEGCACG